MKHVRSPAGALVVFALLMGCSARMPTTPVGLATATSPPPAATPARTASLSAVLELDLRLAGQAGGVMAAVAVEGSRAYAGVGPRLWVVDLADPASPHKVGESPVLPGVVRAVAVRDSYAYVAAGAGLAVLEVRGRYPQLVGTGLPVQGTVEDVALVGHYAYLVTADCTAEGCQGELLVLDLADPAAPRQVGALPVPGGGFDLAVGDGGDSPGYLYVLAGSGLLVVDVTDPAAPTEAGAFAADWDARSMAVAGGHAYVAARSAGLRILDLRDPASPEEVATYRAKPAAPIHLVAANGRHAYAVSTLGGHGCIGAGIQALDLDDPCLPRELGATSAGGVPGGLWLVDGYACYTSLGDDTTPGGLYVIDVHEPGEPRQAGYLAAPGPALGAATADEWAYVATGSSVQAIEASEAADPRVCDTIALPASTAVAARFGCGHVAASSDGLRVLDLSEPSRLRVAGRLDGLWPAYDVDTWRDYACVLGDRLWVLEVQDSCRARVAGVLELEGMPSRLAVEDGYAYLVGEVYEGSTPRGALWIVDVTEPARPRLAGRVLLPSAATGVALARRYAYVTTADCGGDCRQGGVSGSLQVVDVSDPAGPRLVTALDLPAAASDVSIAGDYAFVAGVDRSRGSAQGSVRVIDISEPRAPREAGTCLVPGFPRRLVALGGYRIYAAADEAGLLILQGQAGPLTVKTPVPPPTGPLSILYARDDDLWRTDAHGSSHERLSVGRALAWGMGQSSGWRESAAGRGAQVSPDGRWIAIAGGEDLVVIDVAAHAQTMLHASHAPGSAFAWAPDSQTFAYVAPVTEADEGGVHEIRLYDPQRHTAQTVLSLAPEEAGIVHLAWSPDGHRLGFSCCFQTTEPYDGRSIGVAKQLDLATARVDTTGIVTISIASRGTFCWSPDGELITNREEALQRCPRGSRSISPDGTRSYAVGPVSPEDTLLEGPILLTVHTVDGGEPGPELWRRELPPGWFGVQWSADGRYLLLEDGMDVSPIWALSADGTGDVEVLVEDGYLLGVVAAWE